MLRRAVVLRGRCGVWSGPGELRRPPGDLNVFLPPCVPVSEQPRTVRRAGPLSCGTLPPPPPESPELKGASPGRSGSRFPFLWGRGGARALLTPKFGLRWVVGWSCSVRAVEQLQAMRSQPAAAAGARGRGAPRLPGSRARPRTLFSFSGLFVPLSVFCHPPPERGSQTKESLYFFSGLVK